MCALTGDLQLSNVFFMWTCKHGWLQEAHLESARCQMGNQKHIHAQPSGLSILLNIPSYGLPHLKYMLHRQYRKSCP